MRERILLFIISFLVWIFLNWPIGRESIFVGIGVAGLVVFLIGDLFISPSRQQRSHLRYLWLLYYIPLLLWEFFKATLHVARRILTPSLPINPGIVKVKTTLKSDTGLTFLANALTLARVAFCVDCDPEQGILYVHWLDVKTEDEEQASLILVSRFEKVLKKIFD